MELGADGVGNDESLPSINPFHFVFGAVKSISAIPFLKVGGSQLHGREVQAVFLTKEA